MDDNDYRSLSAANYWANKAAIEKEDARLQHNRNRIESIADGQKIRQLVIENNELKAKIEDLKAANKTYEEYIISEREKNKDEENFYKNLLSKPMREIAEIDNNFKLAYEKQQELLATWMVTQRAYKEMAIDFGLKLGKTKQEITEALVDEKISKVLNDETEHGNNAEESVLMTLYVEKLKKKLLK